MNRIAEVAPLFVCPILSKDINEVFYYFKLAGSGVKIKVEGINIRQGNEHHHM